MLSTCTTIDNLIPTLHVVMSNVHMLLNSQNLPIRTPPSQVHLVLLASCAKQNLALYLLNFDTGFPYSKQIFMHGEEKLPKR